MYCSRCHYDLRLLDTGRCPECGSAFDDDDPSSYVLRRPGPAARAMLWFRWRRRQVLLVALTALLLMSYVVAGDFMRQGRMNGFYAESTRENLKQVLAAWRIQQAADPEQLAFDAGAAREILRPSLSQWSEAQAEWERASLTYALARGYVLVIPTLVYLLAVAALFGGRLRRGALILIVVPAALAVGSAYPDDVAAWIYPGTYAFLDDYVYMDGVVLTSANANRGRTIAAYDKPVFRQTEPFQWCVIGFADGHVLSYPITADWPRSLFEAQGIPYPDTTPPSD